MKKRAFLIPALLPCVSTWAHEGHGLSGPHWHATDAWGFAVVAALIVLAIWLSRGGK